MPKKYVHEVDQELGVGELPLFTFPGVGNRPPRKKKNCISPGVCPEGMVTGQIQPCIRGLKFADQLNLKWQNLK